MKIKLEGIIRALDQYTSKEMAHLTVEMSSHRVWLNGVELNWKKSLAVRNHSPSGLNWGYGGSGPSQFALAVCMELFGIRRAQKVYQDFKTQYISSLPFDKDFAVELDISAFIIAHEEQFKQGDQEAEEDRLWQIEKNHLEEAERKNMDENLQIGGHKNRKRSSKRNPDLIERFSKLIPIKFEFESLGKQKSICNLIISEKDNLVIATEIEENPGPSITTVAAVLANKVCINFKLNKSKLILIEHYSNRSYLDGRDDDNFALVNFRKDRFGNFTNPEWSFLPLKQMEEFLVLLE